MRCPACEWDGATADFGTPARCPECGAFYDKALIVRAKKIEALAAQEAREERDKKIGHVTQKAAWVAGAIADSSSKAMNSNFLRSPIAIGGIFFVILSAYVYFEAWRRGGFGSEKLAATPQVQREASEWAVNAVGERAVLARLKDPDSASFRSQFRGKSGAACGEVNSKNSFGGYKGYQRYMASGGGLVFFEEEIAPAEFEGAWSNLCR